MLWEKSGLNLSYIPSLTAYLSSFCFFKATNVLIRLEGPSSENGTGRVEILYNGTWGTVCDDEWDLKDAKVVCRQLAYPDAVRSLQQRQAPPGSGKIWLDNVGCTGEEENISRCYHRGWGIHNCVHSEDAGVECSKTGEVTKNICLLPIYWPIPSETWTFLNF